MDEEKIEKVVKALQLCRYDPDPGQECKQLVACDICPYWRDTDFAYGCHDTEMFNDAIEVITHLRKRASEPTKFDIKHAISNVDIPKGMNELDYLELMSHMYAALAKLYGEDIPVIVPSEGVKRERDN